VAPVEHVTLPTAERPRALVVDDSATVRALHSLLLEELGYRVETVQDGQVAFSRALEVPFAVVVAGLQTRGLNGFQLASALRAQPAYQGVPIVLMSADADAVLTQRAVEAGASVLLRKGSWATQQLSTTLAGLAAARAG
jgi:CheY-like chemotaxis protein